MATILKNIVQFTDLVVDVGVALPHLLNVNGIPVTPQLGGVSESGFEVFADETNVYISRTPAATSDAVNVFVEYWHTIEAVTPPGKLVGLTPFFFAAGGGGSGGGDEEEKVFASVVINPFGGLEKRIAYFNVGNVVKNGTGDWTITFDNPFPVGYFPVATFGLRGPGVTAICSYETIDNFSMQIFTNDPTGTSMDPNYVNVVVHLALEIID